MAITHNVWDLVTSTGTPDSDGVYPRPAALKMLANDSGGDWLTDGQYRKFLAKHTVGSETTVTLNKSTAGYYVYRHGTHPYALLLANHTIPFTGEDGLTYETYTEGINVYVSTGVHSTDTIEIVGSLVDYNALAFEILTWLASHRSMEISQSGRLGDVDIGGARRILLDMAQSWRGIRGG